MFSWISITMAIQHVNIIEIKAMIIVSWGHINIR